MTTESPDAAHQFDFLEGEWDAVCHFPNPDGTWGQGFGSLRATRVLDGAVFLEFFEGPYLGLSIKGLGLRAYNRERTQWEHTWTDSESPGNFHVWRGSFEGGAISLLSEWKDARGDSVLSRLTWSEIAFDRAHWESHRSYDGGRTWEKHWVIDFKKKPDVTSNPGRV
jgi:hypothetical protein